MEKLEHIEAMIQAKCVLNQAAQSLKESYTTFRSGLFDEIERMVKSFNEPMSSERFNAYVSTGDSYHGRQALDQLVNDYKRYTDALSIQEILPTRRVSELTVEEFRLLMTDIIKSAR